MNNPDEIKLYQKAIGYLSRRAHSVTEMRQKLSRPPRGVDSQEINSELVNSVISKLISQGLLDDLQFATDFVRYQLSRKPQGAQSLAFQLRRKGIDRTQVDQVIKATFSDPDLSYQLAKSALEHKHFSSSATPQQAAAKVARFLASRGFAYSVIRRFIDDLHQK